MKCFILTTALSLLVLFPSTLFGQVTITKENRIENIGPIGFCGPCCMETIGRQFGYNVTRNYATSRYERYGDYGGIMFEHDIWTELERMKIPYKRFARGAFKYAGLGAACEMKQLSIVELKPAPEQRYGHYVVITNFDENNVTYFDCNDITRDYVMTRAQFAAQWYGNMIVIYNRRSVHDLELSHNASSP